MSLVQWVGAYALVGCAMAGFALVFDEDAVAIRDYLAAHPEMEAQ